jgi:uncharacterized membrane protein
MQTGSMERTAVPGIVSFEERIEVPAPVSEVYRRWTDFSRFPEFMQNVKEVRSLGGGRYRWVGRVLGTRQEWDSEVIDQQENQRISWRSLNGPMNAGTVRFQPLPNNRTEVQLRMEYAPPGGAVGQKLEKLTQSTRKEVKQDLQNFRRLIAGEREGIEGVRPGIGGVAGALAIPASAAIIGGVSSFLIERRLHPISLRVRMKRQALVSPVSPPAVAASWLLGAMAQASIIASAIFRARGDRTNALFVGQWAPTFLGASILARMVGHRGVQPRLPAVVASWALAAASAGSIVSSIITHLRANRHDGLFVGEWAPTFLGAAILSRLIGKSMRSIYR